MMSACACIGRTPLKEFGRLPPSAAALRPVFSAGELRSAQKLKDAVLHPDTGALTWQLLAPDAWRL